ncbi:MAG TPA: hypothetical protein VFB20_15710 [Burkholderiales bacterium]|nr:hypothetical protein [Burkholderiales bacterium]
MSCDLGAHERCAGCGCGCERVRARRRLRDCGHNTMVKGICVVCRHRPYGVRRLRRRKRKDRRGAA